MKKLKLMALATLAIIAGACNGSAGTKALAEKESASVAEKSVEKSVGDYALYSIKSPVRVMRQWSVSVDDAANLPGTDLSDYKAVERAIDAGDLDVMSTTVTTYEFGADGKVKDWVGKYDAQGRASSVGVHGLPGVFDITYANGRPAKFVLAENSLDEIISLDSYDYGLEIFTISYDDKGMPASLTGKAMGFFGGGAYKETYSDYRFDAKGNWIRRKKTGPYSTNIEYRSYEY